MSSMMSLEMANIEVCMIKNRQNIWYTEDIAAYFSLHVRRNLLNT
jgi:hypothetical protein